MSDRGKLLVIEVKNGWTEIYFCVPTKLIRAVIAIITAIPVVAQFLKGYPQIAAILRAVISGG